MIKDTNSPLNHAPNAWALIPLLVFLLTYLVVSILAGDFYKMPITVAFVISSVVAIAISKGGKLSNRIEQFCRGAANTNIMLMVLIFILAGAFAQTAKSMGAVDATVNLAMSILPGNLLAAGIFLAANLRSSAPTIGDPFTLKIVAACALGGTSLAGGKGSELGTILGVFTVAIIENGMNFIGVNAYYQNIVFGIFVLAAIALTVDRSIRGQIVK